MNASRERVSFGEILETCSSCADDRGSFHIGDVKTRVLENHSGSLAQYSDERSFRNSIQGLIERSASGRAGAGPPYYFIGLNRGWHQITEYGLDALKAYKQHGYWVGSPKYRGLS